MHTVAANSHFSHFKEKSLSSTRVGLNGDDSPPKKKTIRGFVVPLTEAQDH